MEQHSSTSNLYFVAVVLPPHLDKKIRTYKTWMQETYGCKAGLKSPAHITIAPPFWMAAVNEEKRKEDITAIAKQVAPFTLTTAGFSAFRPRTIFIATEKSGELDAVKETSDSYFGGRDYKMKRENRPFHPHITIATRDLHTKDFAEAWPLFAKKDFKEIFVADGLSLLKHNGRTWDVIYKALFTAT